MIASNWRRREQNTLRGFFDLELPSGLRLHDCSLHELGDRRWISLPMRPQLSRDGVLLKSPKTNKPVYATCVDVPNPSRKARFQAEALAAIDKLMGKAP